MHITRALSGRLKSKALINVISSINQDLLFECSMNIIWRECPNTEAYSFFFYGVIHSLLLNKAIQEREYMQN